MSKARGLLSKLISDSLQPIIEGKMQQEGWDALQEKFQHIDGMSPSSIIYEVTSRELAELKDVVEYTSSYQAAFDKVASLLADTSTYTRYTEQHRGILSSHNGYEYWQRILYPCLHHTKGRNGKRRKPSAFQKPSSRSSDITSS